MTSKNGAVGYKLPADDYAALKKLADDEDRSIPAQARHMMRGALNPKPPPTAHQNPTSATPDTPEFVGDDRCLDPDRCDAQHNLVDDDTRKASLGGAAVRKMGEPRPG